MDLRFSCLLFSVLGAATAHTMPQAVIRIRITTRLIPVRKDRLMWLLLVVFAALGDIPKETILVHTEFPLTTWEECTEKAEELAVESMMKNPDLANYKFYLCVKEQI